MRDEDYAKIRWNESIARRYQYSSKFTRKKKLQFVLSRSCQLPIDDGAFMQEVRRLSKLMKAEKKLKSDTER